MALIFRTKEPTYYIVTRVKCGRIVGMKRIELQVEDSKLTEEQSAERINVASKRLLGMAMGFCGADALSAYIALGIARELICSEVALHIGDNLELLTEWLDAKDAADKQLAKMKEAKKQ